MNSPHYASCIANDRLLCFVVLASVFCLASGCKLTRLTEPVTGAGYTPKNVYQAQTHLPVHVRRVVVLPVTCHGDYSDVDAGREMLDPVIADELGRTHKFELVRISPDTLRSLTGRRAWSAEDALPDELLKHVRIEMGCDAILFTKLTQFRAYPPLAVGLSFKLVELDKGEYVWAVDEVFDANEPGVVNDARRFQQTRERLPASLADSRTILNSPSVFGRYAANSVFQTLPSR